MLVRLVYASRATKPIESQVVDDILSRSRKNNQDAGITGVLCVCHGNVYLQVLEGGRTEVNRLYGKLMRDERHSDVTLLHYSEIEQRRFSGWRMGRVDVDKVNIGIVLRYSEKRHLDPFSLSGASAMALLEELINTASIMGGS
jgi:hypothetical protein